MIYNKIKLNQNKNRKMLIIYVDDYPQAKLNLIQKKLNGCRYWKS